MSLLNRRTDEDLFEESTMSFGEHLEELRKRLFRAVLGLVAMTCIGILIGTNVVEFIQRPLHDALIRYYENRSVAAVEKQIDSLRKMGYTLPDDPALIDKFVKQRGLIFEEVFVNPRELLLQIGLEEAARTYKKSDRAREQNLLPASKPAPAPPAEQTVPLRTTQATTGAANHHAANDEAAQGLATAANVPRDPADDLVPVYLWRRIADDPRVRVTSLNAPEAFMIYMKASLLVGLVLASPVIFYQLWAFVAAGLYRHERRFIYIFLPFSLVLFLAGVGLAFFFVFQPVLDFLFQFNGMMGIDPEPRISEWLSFVLFMPLGFGVSFQLPLVMLFLERIGIMTVASYLSYWRIAVLVICVAAMVLTPSGDPYSMLMMAAPLVVLYFGGIALCYFLPRSKFSRFDTN